MDTIAEVGIDAQGQLYVRPSTATFPYIYREAAEVRWEPSRRRLASPLPREWSYLRWFQQIIHGAASHSPALELTASTAWTNIPDELRAEILHWSSTQTSTSAA